MTTTDLTQGLTPTDLANTLVGAGVTVSNPIYQGAPVAAGRFSGGESSVGFASGIILSSGNVADVIGPNNSDFITTEHGTPGDPDLAALTGRTSLDAAVLEFDFVPNGSAIQFRYVFSSDEYNEFVNTEFDDVFAFFINGVNCATIDGQRVSINAINGGNPFGTNATNPHLYRNNDPNDPAATIDAEMDGLTIVLTCTASVNPNVTNHIKLAISDSSDQRYDSNVFIQAGSLTTAVAAPTTLGLTSSANPSTFGQPVTLTATVTSSAPGTPTGTVAFRANGVVVATVPLTGGTAQYTTSSLPVGTHTINADYSGDTAFQPSGQSIQQTVGAAATTIALTSSANPSSFGQPVTLTATVTSPAGTPTGTVQFREGNVLLAEVPLAGSTGTFTTTGLSVGVHTLTASYSGAPGFQPSSATLTQTVQRAPSSTALSTSANPSTFGQEITFTATVTSSAPVAPTGTVTFSDGTTTLGTAPLDAIGRAQLTTSTPLAAGGHTITASYSGDGVTAPSSASLTETVNKAPASIWVGTSPNPSAPGQAVGMIALVDATAPGPPTGTVTFRDGDTVLGEAPVDAMGRAVISAPGLALGSHTITATYSGNASFLPATASTEHLVERAATSTALTADPSPSIFGQPVTLTASVTSSAPGSPTGTVTFRDGDTVLGEAPVSSGKATVTTSALGVGTHTVTATYAGDATFSTSTGSVSHVVNRAATSVTVVSSANPSTVSQPVTFTATVTLGASGSVTFRTGDRTLGDATLDASGKAMLTVATLTGGAHTVTASYPGDATFEPSTASLSQVVDKAASNTALTSSANPSSPDQPVTLIATVHAQAGAPTGTVTFREGDTVLGESQVESGRATLAMPSLAAGTHDLIATYNGDASFLPSSASFAQNVVAPGTPPTTPTTPTTSTTPPTPTSPPAATTPGQEPGNSTGPPAPAGSSTPTVSVFPAVSTARRVFELSGSGFAPQVEVTLRWESGAVAAVVTTDAQGRFGPVSAIVQFDGAGPRPITATGPAGDSASTTLLVTTPTAQPSGLEHVLTARTRLIHRR